VASGLTLTRSDKRSPLFPGAAGRPGKDLNEIVSISWQGQLLSPMCRGTYDAKGGMVPLFDSEGVDLPPEI
jgi:hypothetical protein